VATGWNGFVAFQDFRFIQDSCEQDTVCTFESDKCGWAFDPTDKKSQRAPARFFDNGMDHTTRSPGGYVAALRFDTSEQSVQLTSPPMDRDSKHQCVTFWFLRSGSGKPTDVTLRFVQVDQSTEKKLLWQSNHTHLMNEWIRVQNSVDIVIQSRLVIEATLNGMLCDG